MNVIYNLEFSCEKSHMEYPHNQHFYVILRKMERQQIEVDELMCYETTKGAKISYEIGGFYLIPNLHSEYYSRIGCHKEEFQRFLKNTSFPSFIQKLKNHTETVKLYTPHQHIIARALKNLPFLASYFSSVPSIINPNDIVAFNAMSSFLMKSVFKQTQ